MVLLALAISVMILPIIVFAINTGVLNVAGEATFDQDIKVSGVVIGTSHLEIAEGIDFLDNNGLRRYSSYIQLSGQTLFRDIPDDLNGIFVFESATTLNPFELSWIFWDSVTDRPSFVIQDGFVGRASIFERSLIIGKQKGAADLNLNYNVCPLGNMDLADCNTPLTGADLIVEDDIEAFGSIKTHENLIVDANITGNQFYGSMFQFDLSNVIVISTTNVNVPIDDFTQGSSNGFSLITDENLLVVQSGTYKVDWGISKSNGNKRTFRGGISVNGVLQEQTVGFSDTEANLVSNMSGTGIISLVQGDSINLVIANVDNIDNITIEAANVSLVRVGR